MRLNSNMLLAIVAPCPSIESLTLNLESIEFDNNFISLPQSFGLPKLKHLTLIKLGPSIFPVINKIFNNQATYMSKTKLKTLTISQGLSNH